MKYQQVTVSAGVIFNSARKGAKYSLDGEKWFNHGDLCEILAKVAYGYPPIKDGNTPFDKGSDIAELGISVKSIGCGLTDSQELRGLPREQFIKEYFKRVHSNQFLWITEHSLSKIEMWLMNRNEFKEFVKATAAYDSYAKKIRFKKGESTFRAKLTELLNKNNEGSVL